MAAITICSDFGAPQNKVSHCFYCFPITSWQIDGETVETVADFIFGGSKITADGDCSHEIMTLTPWKESFDQPRKHIKKQRHYFANKGPSSQGYGFSSDHVWSESWTVKKAER